MTNEIKRISLRVPVELHERLQKAADNERRSLHAQMIEILDEHDDPHRLHLRATELERQSK